MKKKSILAGALLITSLLSVPSVSLADEVHDHGHNHETVGFDHIGDKLPKAGDFKDLESAPSIEQSTDVVEFNSKGKEVEKHRTESNTGGFSIADTGSQKVTVLAVADEEYRAAYPDWQQRIISIVEQADNAFNRDHDVDYVVEAVGQWSSSGSNSSALLQDLQRDWDGRGYDFVAGFTRDSRFDAGGIAYVYSGAPSGSAISVNLDQGTRNTAYAAQHEFTHNYGIGHDAQGSGIRCIMNYDYSYTVDYWDEGHDRVLSQNKFWYGS
ncbi:peptidase M84 [Virgibacillus sp. 7505]|uniref:zinc-dependent metalloprotease n=1 Tax=Virgibacillus sp. 7505 TaxID=2022548 RepID=UPI000BA5094F|nr:zinc-dependent metalloprotease [Virgibacillus sp. 7505]PAE15853.1 peptidase M84 [Virgibacillus sp. 7505]